MKSSELFLAATFLFTSMSVVSYGDEENLEVSAPSEGSCGSQGPCQKTEICITHQMAFCIGGDCSAGPLEGRCVEKAYARQARGNFGCGKIYCKSSFLSEKKVCCKIKESSDSLTWGYACAPRIGLCPGNNNPVDARYNLDDNHQIAQSK